MDSSQKAEHLDSLVSRSGATFELPDLRTQSALEKFMDEITHQINQWLQMYVGQGKYNFSFEGVERYILWGVTLLLAALLIWVIVKIVMKYSGRDRPQIFAPPALAMGGDLERELEATLQQKNFAQAARIRWKIYLQRTRLSQGSTPQEIVALRNFEKDAYPLMFGSPGPNAGSLFNHLATYLSKQESSHSNEH